MIQVSKDLTDEEVEFLEKLIVKLHYDKRVDIYSLCSKHNPDAYARSQKKQKIPESIRWKVWRRDDFTCLYCLGKDASLTLDHVKPEEQGGTFDADNLVTACGKCNNKKGNRDVNDFLKDPWLSNRRKLNSKGLSNTEILNFRTQLFQILLNQAPSIPTGVLA